jgi:precorrin-2 methylase
MIIGTIHGVGLGPGAPDLLSVRADRLVRGTRHIAYFRKAGAPDRRGALPMACCAPMWLKSQWNIR